MREACKFNVRIHNGNILMSSVTKDPGVSCILLFRGSGINFPRPLCYCACIRLVEGLLRPRLSFSKLSKALSSGKVSGSATPTVVLLCLFKGWLRVYYGLDLLLSKLSKAQRNKKFRERHTYCVGGPVVA